MGYKPTVKPRTRAEIAMEKRALAAREREELLQREAEAAKMRGDSYATSQEWTPPGFAKGGSVKKSKKSKNSKKPRGSGCAARTKRTKTY